MRIAITGARGLFGRHLCALLTTRGIAHVPLTRQHWDMRHWADGEKLTALMNGATVVVHAGGCLPSNGSVQEMFDTNLRATFNLADWAAASGVHLIFLSSATVYADPHAQRISESDPVGAGNLGGIYAISKRLAEQALAEYAALGLKLTVLRPSSVYGAGMAKDQLIAQLLDRAADGRPIAIHGPDNRFDFLHVHDFARAVLLAAESGVEGTYNIASGSATALAELADFVADLGNTTTVVLSPPAAVTPFTRFRLDIAAAQSSLGFAPVVPLRTGLVMTRDGALLPPT